VLGALSESKQVVLTKTM